MTASKSSRARNARARQPRRQRSPASTVGTRSTAVRGPGRRRRRSGRNGRPDRPQRAVGGQRRGPGRSGAAVARSGRRGPRAVGGRGRRPAPSWRHRPAGTVPLWLQIVTFAVLALAGLGVSIYLTIAHFTESTLLGCSESGLVNCTKVTTSPQSYVFGIPVAVLGLAFYVAAVALISPWAWRWQGPARGRPDPARPRWWSGMGFVIYLLYAELYHHREHLPVLHQRARRHVPAVRADRLRRGGLGTAGRQRS